VSEGEYGPVADTSMGDKGVHFMKTKAAVLWELGKPWELEELELDGPGENEVLSPVHARRALSLRRAPP
jgi:hypothetical protein